MKKLLFPTIAALALALAACGEAQITLGVAEQLETDKKAEAWSSQDNPALFGAGARHPTVRTKDRRTAFELAMTRGALERDMPILGICGGQQLLHVALGGTLIQHIPDAIKGALAHEQPNPRNEPSHPVAIKAGSRLREIVGADSLAVNSAHHQAAADEPAGIVVNAVAPDGVIEGIEAPGRRFCVGVQWHPEFAIGEGDVKLFAAFVTAAEGGQP